MDSQRISNTIIITSGKGGVGKTWLSINLAQAFVNHKKRVLLFDGDLGLANMDIQLGLKSGWDLGSVLKEKCTFEDAIFSHKINLGSKTYVDIITGRTIDGAFTTVSKAGVLRLRDSLVTVAPKYDHMIMDLSAGLDQIIQEFSTFAYQCLVVVTDEPASLADASAFIKVTSQRNPDLPLNIVVNMAQSDKHGKQTYASLVKECGLFLNKPPSLAGIIHQDRSVPDSILHKTSTLTRYPKSQAARDIKRMAAALL
jgi:flagellar biosynthesis protein FlhG